ncbi:DNA-3-methyladenine glycosylase [Candidatus Nomurabacteria bacterium]|nr:DNA-3-methyladenine glycosylase [Candidatus Nomurabacteria bacterium]
MSKSLTATFFDRSAEIVARELLGCVLCVRVGKKVERHLITETEAYVGPHDLASHASKGRTPRTEVMFGKPGTIYVYLIYGMYDMLNFVTGEKDYPAAVLIRGVGEWNGPGKLTKALKITRAINGKPLGKQTGLWVEERPEDISPKQITTAPRIGVAYAKEWAAKELRFSLC